MRIVAISDTHSYNAKIGRRAGEDDSIPTDFVPDGDILIHAGDLTDTGKPNQLFDAYAWLNKMPHEHVIAIPGNHDFGFEQLPELRGVLDAKFKRVRTLIDESVTVAGLNIYGSPFTPWFHDWAFNFLPGPAGEQQAKKRWAAIPDDTHILITHGPPFGILDETLRRKHVGCPQLRERILQLKQLKLHVFGHIHEGHGAQRVGDVLYVNACTCDHLYDPVQIPMVIDWDGNAMKAVQR